MWRSRRRWAALACLVFPVCLAGARQDPWLSIRSANFELYTTAGERAGRDLIKHFEQVRSFFTQAFGSRLAAARPARLIVFRNEKEYQPYRPNEFAGAFYQPGAAHDFIVMSGASSEHYTDAVGNRSPGQAVARVGKPMSKSARRSPSAAASKRLGRPGRQEAHPAGPLRRETHVASLEDVDHARCLGRGEGTLARNVGVPQ